jgi:hypothetical protein
MGLLSVLGKIAKPIVGLLPGGGTLTGALDLASDVGGVLGAGGAAAKHGRMDEADLQARMNGLNNRAQLDAAQFNMGAPVTRAQQVAKGDLMSANIPQSQSTGSGRDVSFSGGIGPQYFGADTTQAGNEMKRQALMALMSGSDQVHPAMSSIPKSGILEKIGGTAGLIGGLVGAIPQRQKVATMQPQQADPYEYDGQEFG